MRYTLFALLALTASISFAHDCPNGDIPDACYMAAEHNAALEAHAAQENIATNKRCRDKRCRDKRCCDGDKPVAAEPAAEDTFGHYVEPVTSYGCGDRTPKP